MNLSGNTILITGGTSGIGQAFAEEFHKAGSKVIICGRKEDKLKEMEEQYPGMVGRVCDLSDTKEREALAKWTIENYPDTNILMNNAGVQFAFDLTKAVDINKVQTEIQTNLVAPIELCGLFTRHLAAKAEAAIINISSGLAFAPLAFMPVYCSTKAAIHSFTMSLRHQLRNTSIKVFEVAPPSTDTQLGHERWAGQMTSHGGLPVEDFIKEAMQALKDDLLEAPIADAKNLRAKGETMFPVMNRS